MCTYIYIFFRMTLYSADSNCQTSYRYSSKTARNEHVCAHQKSYRKQIFQNNFGAITHLIDCSCASILQFFDAALDRATANRQIPDNILGQFFTSLRKDSVANFASIWTLFSPVARGFGVLYNTLNIS